jgi:hypothetical protein
MQILGISNFYPTAPTTAPTSLSAVPTNVDVAISFTAPTNDGGMPITNYEYSFNNSTWTALSPADAASPVTVGGLTQNTAYTVYLRAVNGIGSGPGSTGVSFTTAGVPTGTPTITSVPVGTTTATVNFTYPGGGGAVTGYDLYVANQTNAWNNTTASPISVSGLTPNSYYVFYVRAKNAYGVGPQSAGFGATTNPTFMVASGGTTLDYASGGFTYRSHAFTSSSTFSVSSAGSFGTVDVLVVAGGGGGGLDRGGGGGAGGFRTTTQTLGAGNYGVTVGGAGAGGAGPTSGGASGFNGFNATGGGRGSVCCYIGAASGGSGGGANPGSGPGAGNAGGYSPVEGYRGGNSNDGWMGAGGGGASGVGGDNSYGAGGAGAVNAFRTGSNITYSNGGNGMPTTGNSGNFGAGGGGNTNGVQGTVVVRYRIA